MVSNCLVLCPSAIGTVTLSAVGNSRSDTLLKHDVVQLLHGQLTIIIFFLFLDL